MYLRLHLPPMPEAPPGWSPAQQARLHATVARALARASAALESEGAQVLIVEMPRDGRARGMGRDGSGAAHSEREAPRERLAAGQVRGAGDLYGIPSYDDGGAEVQVPVKERDGGRSDLHFRTAAGDAVEGGNFENVPVIQLSGKGMLEAGGSPYAIAGNIARAVAWGRYLFGGRGFAILQERKAYPNGPFHVVPMADPLGVRDLGGLQPLSGAEADTLGATGRYARLISLVNYHPVMVVTREGNQLFSAYPADPWNYKNVRQALSRVPRNERSIDPEDVRSITRGLLQQAEGAGGESAEVDVIVNMNAAVFAAMPWDQRARYLELLIKAWTGEREEIAIIEIIRGTRTVAELEAIFARLRDSGIYAQMFDDLDDHVYELLQLLSEYRPGGEINWRYMLRVLDMGLIPEESPDLIADLTRMAAGLSDWVQGIFVGVKFLLTRPDEVIEGLAHLPEFIWILQKAQWGDPQAVQLVSQMVLQAGQKAAKALRGMEYAEELGTSYAGRSAPGSGPGAASEASAGPNSTGIGKDIVGRLKAMLLFEVLSWFIGIGEIKAAIAAAGTLPEKLALLADVLRGLRIFAKAAETGAEAAKLERVLLAIARAAEIAEEARIARVAELLPEGHLVELGRLAEAADLKAGAGFEALRAALKGKPDLLRTADRLRDALAVAGRLEARAASAGGVTAEMAGGLRALLNHAPLTRQAMIDLIEHVPAERLGEFMHTLTFVPPARFSRWGAQGLRELAEHPRALALIREAGADLVDLGYSRMGNSWEGFERFMDGLAARQQQLGNPAEYQRLLERLGRGEAAAFDEVLAAAGLNRLRLGNRRQLLADLAAIAERDPALHTRRATELAQLTDRELDGLEAIARLNSDKAGWGQVLDTVLAWSPADRADMLALVGDVAGATNRGLDKVMEGIFGLNVKTTGSEMKQIQGGWGQLYAARTLIRNRGATNLAFEVRETFSGLIREYDIICDTPAGRLRVEVKTNLTGSPFFNEWQVQKDLVSHAGSGYNDLLYLYHPGTGGQLPGLRQSMLNQFSNPAVQKLFSDRGIDIIKAEQDFQRWVTRGVSTYGF